jgi:hypothetical protein
VAVGLLNMGMMGLSWWFGNLAPSHPPPAFAPFLASEIQKQFTSIIF